ncbi:uncharacterized protein YALI1_F11711g [Yarrowia lipolytica]|uniref:Uncharacterized protein n=1 Tax=Yarrowia lipolytica TaxID=4952 RepID=A0A1D8NMJ2_YARLL|nr:hypothetical protein YALI1_F11711g [Yarrowia lipolytica]
MTVVVVTYDTTIGTYDITTGTYDTTTTTTTTAHRLSRHWETSRATDKLHSPRQTTQAPQNHIRYLSSLLRRLGLFHAALLSCCQGVCTYDTICSCSYDDDTLTRACCRRYIGDIGDVCNMGDTNSLCTIQLFPGSP